MSSSRFLRSGLSWARNSHGHRGFAFTQEDLGNIVSPTASRDDRKKRKRADSSKTENLIVGKDMLDSAFMGLGGIGVELPTLEPMDFENTEDPFSFAPLEEGYNMDSLGLDQDIASTLSTPFPISPQVTTRRRSVKKSASAAAKNTQEPAKKKVKAESSEVEMGDKRGRKNFRERQRRETMKRKFDELTRLIENDELKNDEIPKMKKMDVLSKAIGTIKELQEQVQQFQMDRYRMAVMLKEQSKNSIRSNKTRRNDIDGFLKKMDIDLNQASHVIRDQEKS